MHTRVAQHSHPHADSDPSTAAATGGRYTHRMRRFVRRVVHGDEGCPLRNLCYHGQKQQPEVVTNYPPAFESLGGACLIMSSAPPPSAREELMLESISSSISDDSRVSASAEEHPMSVIQGTAAFAFQAVRFQERLRANVDRSDHISPLSPPPRPRPTLNGGGGGGLSRMATSRDLTLPTPPPPKKQTASPVSSKHNTQHHPLECNHRMVNVDRGAYQLRPLTRDVNLDTLARQHAERMATTYQLDWPQGLIGDDFGHVGVNVCRGTLPVPQLHLHLIQDGDSADRFNLLSETFTHMGCGTAVSADGVNYLCQILGRRKQKPSQPQR